MRVLVDSLIDNFVRHFNPVTTSSVLIASKIRRRRRRSQVLITPAQDSRMAIRRLGGGRRAKARARGVALFFVDSPDDI